MSLRIACRPFDSTCRIIDSLRATKQPRPHHEAGHAACSESRPHLRERSLPHALHHQRRRLVAPLPSLPYQITSARSWSLPVLQRRRPACLRPQWARGVLMASSSTTTMPALIGRILWMMVGPITLLLLALHIAQQLDRWFT